MSWVSPIKDKETLQKFENGLKAAVKSITFCLRSVLAPG